MLRYDSEFRHILVATEGREGERTRRLRELGVSVIYVTGSFWHKVRLINTLVRGLETSPILHCHLFRPECLGFFVRHCCAKLTTKYCTYASDSQVGDGIWGRLRRRIDNSIWDKAISLAFSDIVVITKELMRLWRWHPGRRHFIEISTLTQYAEPPPFRIIGEDMVLIVATRMVGEKDHDLLVESLRHMRYGKLYMFGDGPLRSKVVRALATAGIANVEVMGAVPRQVLFSYMKKADAMLLTSSTEGLPLLIQEAMSLGLPVVATDVGGNRKLIDDRSGRIVSERTPEAFAAAVNSLVGCDAGALGRVAIERARCFSLAKTVKAINQVYRDLVSREAS